MALAKKRKIQVLVTVVIAVVLIGCGAAYAFYAQHQREVYEKEHQKYEVALNVAIEGYDTAASTPVPISIHGTDFEGNEVHERMLYANAQDTPVELMRGDYELEVVSSPILADGTIFVTEIPPVSFTVLDPEEPEGSEAGAVNSTAIPALVPIAALEATPDQIEAARAALVELGMTEDAAEEFAAKATARHQVALDEKVAAEKAVAEAAARAEAKATYTADLAQIRRDMENDVRMGGSSMMMAEAAGEYSQEFTALMNEILEYLEGVLPADEYAALQDEQSAWQQKLEAAMDESIEEFRSPDGILSGSGFSMSMFRSDESILRTEDRIAELLKVV